MVDIPGLPRNKDAAADRKFIEALARGLDVLRAFQPGDGLLGNQEIAQRTGLPKSSVSRLTYTLTTLGYLTYSERMEKYQLGSGVLALGYAFVSNLAIRQIAKPLMQELANNTGTSVGLSDRDRFKMIYVEYCSPNNVMAFRHEVGDRVSLATGSAGRAYLAALPEDEREFFFSHLKQKDPQAWAHTHQGIMDSLQHYQVQGFCYSYGDWNPDVNGISVPLTLGKNTIYCFNAGGPAYRLSRGFLEQEVAPMLKNMVRNIEATLVRY